MNPNLTINPPFIAHRGASRFAPENTVSAFRKAKELGINWVEFDVMLTADDQVVVIHDVSIDRTTNAIGLVRDFTYAYLKTLDAGSWFDSKFHNEKIATLEEIIVLLNHLNLSANIEIKPQVGKEDLIVKKVLSLIANNWTKKNSPFIH